MAGLVWGVVVAGLVALDAGPLLLGLPAVLLLVAAAGRGDDAGRRPRMQRAAVVGSSTALAVGAAAVAARGLGGPSGLGGSARIALAVVALGLVAAALRRVPTPDELGDDPDDPVTDGTPSEPLGFRG